MVEGGRLSVCQNVERIDFNRIVFPEGAGNPPTSASARRREPFANIVGYPGRSAAIGGLLDNGYRDDSAGLSFLDGTRWRTRLRRL